MKKLKLLLLFLFSFVLSYAQFPVNQGLGTQNTLVTIRGGAKADSTFVVPSFRDTSSITNWAKYYAGNIIRVGNTLYLRSTDSTRWIPFANGGGVPNVYNGTRLVSGNAIWQSGLTFFVTDGAYFILGNFYNSNADTVTLAAADPLLPRTDVIYLDTLGQVGVLTGVPSPSPLKPIVNPLSQIELTHIDIGAGATSPSGISFTLVYNENLQNPTEWNTATSEPLYNNFDYTINPLVGTKSLLVQRDAKNSTVSFYSSTEQNVDTCNYLSFYVRLNSEQPASVIVDLPPFPVLNLRLFHNGVQVSNTINITDGSFGYIMNDTANYQHLVIPFSGIVFNNNPRLFDSIAIESLEPPFLGYQLDYFTIQHGGFPPPVISDSWVLTGNDVSATVNPRLGTTSNDDLTIITNDSIRAVVPKEGILRLVGSPQSKAITYDTVSKKLYYTDLGYSFMEQLDSTTVLFCRENGVCDTLELIGGGGGGSTDAIDSVSVTKVAYVDSIFFWRADTVAYQFNIYIRNGLISGCNVSAVNDTTYDVTAAVYVAGGIQYNSTSGQEILTSNTDTTGRYVVIGVDNTGFPFAEVGANAPNPQVPVLNQNQVGCATIYFPPLAATPVINNYTSNVFNVGVDSSAFRSLSVLNDTTAIWCDLAGRCDTLRLRYVGPDGALSGLQVTQLTDSTFGVTAGGYQINSVVYSTLGDTVDIAPPPGVDSSRIDIIAVDTSGAVVVITGVAGIVAAAPDYDYNSQLPLTFILSSQDSVYQTVVVPAPLWSLVGADLTQAAGRRVVLNNGMRLDTINSGGTFPRVFSGNRLYLQANATSGTRVFIGTVGGNTPPTTDELTVGLGTVSGTTGEKNAMKFTGNLINPTGSDQFLSFITGDYTVNAPLFDDGEINFIKHHPTITGLGATRLNFINSSNGDVMISTAVFDIRPLSAAIRTINGSGGLSGLFISPQNKSLVFDNEMTYGRSRIEAVDTTVNTYTSSNVTGKQTGLRLTPDSAYYYETSATKKLLFPKLDSLTGDINTIAAVSQLPTFRTLVADTGLVVRQSNDTAFVGLPYYEVAGLITFDDANNPTLSILINTFPASAGAFSAINDGSGVYQILSANSFFDKTKIDCKIQAFYDTGAGSYNVLYDYSSTSAPSLYFITEKSGTPTEVSSGTTSFSIKQYK